MVMQEKIERRNIQTVAGLTPMQQGMLYHYLKEPDSEAYFEQFTLELPGPVDILSFKQAWNEVVKANDMLRTLFRWENVDQPVQITLKETDFSPVFRDYSQELGLETHEDKQEFIHRLKQKDRAQAFDLREIPFRVTLAILPGDRGLMIISSHHILFDGWSTGVMLEEFFTAYGCYCQGLNYKLEIKPGFPGYIKYLQRPGREDSELYWKNYLEDYEPRFLLKTMTGDAQKARPGHFSYSLDSGVFNRLDRLVRDNPVTLSSLLYFGWGLLLHRYTYSNDIVFGVTVSGREVPVKGIERMVGLFINTVPLRVTDGGERSVLSSIQGIQEVTTGQSLHLHTSLTDIRRYAFGYERLSGEFFDSLMIIENYRLAPILLDKNKVVLHSVEEQTNYPLTVRLNNQANNKLTIDYMIDENHFSLAFIQQLARHFENILDNMARYPGEKVVDINMLSLDEREELVYRFSNSTGVEGVELLVQEVFEQEVRKGPGRLALVAGKERFSYSELNALANNLARELRQKGISRNIPVAMMIDRSAELIIAIMAIIKAGGAYLPIDPTYPRQRKQFMAKDSGTSWLVTRRHMLNDEETNTWKNSNVTLIYTDIMERDKNGGEEQDNLSQLNDENDAVYCIYTSGTTGNPKGVIIEHRNLLTYYREMSVQFSMSSPGEDICASVTNICFDVSAFEFFLALLSGSVLVIANEEQSVHLPALADFIIDNGITMAYIPPYFLEPLASLLAHHRDRLKLKKILTGVEPILFNVVDHYFRIRGEVLIYNAYGPTETTVFVTGYRLEQESRRRGNIPIGRPMGNIGIYILDKTGSPVPMGVPGELYIGGKTVGRGYLNRPDLTAQKFIRRQVAINKNSLSLPTGNTIVERFFKQAPQTTGDILYNTGDLVYWLDNEDICFIGRIDTQMKIRGLRIEPGEIRGCLLEHPQVSDAVVLIQEIRSGISLLGAYVVAKNNHTLDTEELNEFLGKRIPHTWLPSFIVPIQKVPLTRSGKLDRKQLPLPEMDTKNHYLPPQSQTEETLINIWSRLLAVRAETISRDAHFFEMGGNSLSAISLSARIHKILNRNIMLNDIFSHPHLERMAEFLDNAGVDSMYQGIQQVEKREYYPLSAAQERMYVLQQLGEELPHYNMTGFFSIRGYLDMGRLEKTFSLLVKRHSSCRTGFFLVNGMPHQRVWDVLEPEKRLIEYYQYGDDQNGDLEKIVQQFRRPFDLRIPPLLRVGLVEREKAGREKPGYLLMVDMHHIIADGLSIAILIRDFIELYGGNILEDLPLQYADYTLWLQRPHTRSLLARQEISWLGTFKSGIPVLELPLDFTRPTVQDFTGHRLHFVLGEHETIALKKITRELDTTLYIVLLAITGIVLAQLGACEDLVIGSPVAGRSHADLERVMGMFVNTLAIRLYPVGKMRADDYIRETSRMVLSAFENQNYPFEELVDRLDLRRDISRNPLFDVMFVMQNFDMPSFQLPGLEISPFDYENPLTRFDMTLTAEDHPHSIELTWEYCIKLYKQETIERFIRYYMRTVQVVSADLSICLGHIDMLGDEEKQVLLHVFNDTGVEVPGPYTLHERFEQGVERYRDRVALVFTGQGEMHNSVLTYSELNRQAVLLAQCLRKHGVVQGEMVGLMVERSLEMVIGMMAILKAGGAYVPVDPEYPVSRKYYLLEDSHTSILLTSTGGCTEKEREDLVEKGKTVLFLDIPGVYHEGVGEKLFTGCLRDSAAYMIYTSGSTGKPKGVVIEHQSIVNTLAWRKNFYRVNEMDRFLQIPSFSFDSSVEDIFTPLISGAGMVLIDSPMRFDIDFLVDATVKYGINHFLITPKLYDYFLDRAVKMSLPGLRFVTVAGEQTPIHLPGKHFSILPGVALYNEYGPTESSVCVSVHRFERSDRSILIGRPVANMRLYVLNRQQRLCPLGVPGELGISGIGLARGYNQQEALTRERFIENPYEPGQRMYITGDRCRYLQDGNLEFLGRMDEQVKIRGFRVECGEIEAVLTNHPRVKEAVVLPGEREDGDTLLCAYVVLSPEANAQQHLPIHELDRTTANEIEKYLAGELPYYMIPAVIIPLDKIPLTPHGKVDKRRLPAPMGRPGEGLISPRTGNESAWQTLWAEVLGLEKEKISVRDNFFQLGGHSLKGIYLVSRIREEKGIKINLEDIFRFPTIEMLAVHIHIAGVSRQNSLDFAELKEWYVLSSSQQRMFLLHRLNPVSLHYNLPMVLKIKGDIDNNDKGKGELDPGFFDGVFQDLINGHASFRTSFKVIGDQPVQKILPAVEFRIEFYEVSSGDEMAGILERFVRPFDLSCAPLLRAGLVKPEPGHYLLIIDIHHIIGDGVSTDILVKDLVALLRGQRIEVPQWQYTDYSEWQQSPKGRENWPEHEAYWLKAFAGELPSIELPVDFDRPAVQDYNGHVMSINLGEKLTNKLGKLALSASSTLFMVLLSSYTIMLSRLCHQDEIIIGTPVAGRHQPGMEKVIGMFVNTLPLRLFINEQISFQDFLEKVTQQTLTAFTHEDYPFERLVEILNIPRHVSRNPLFDVMFAFMDFESAGLEKLQPGEPADFSFTLYHGHTEKLRRFSRFDMTLFATGLAGDLRLDIEYATTLFLPGTIGRYMLYLENILKWVTENQGQKIARLDFLPGEEKELLIREFNACQRPFDQEKSVIHLLEDNAGRRPSKSALWFKGNDEILDYRELEKRAKHRGYFLKLRGVGEDQTVGIFMERSIDMVVYILATWYAGGAYIPMDPDYPLQRVKGIMDDSSSKVMVTRSGLVTTELEHYFPGMITLSDETPTEPGDDFTGEIRGSFSPCSLAYVIYTSGSTGRPKGAMVEHLGMMNHIQAKIHDLHLDEKSVVAQNASHCFDISVWQFFAGLCSGGKTVIYPNEQVMNPVDFIGALVHDKITILEVVPSYLSVMLDQLEITKQDIKRLKYLLVTGETVKPALVKRWFDLFPGIRMVNAYGPTEASDDITHYIMEKAVDINRVPIGKPIQNFTIFILDDNMNLCPLGVKGEIGVSGIGVGRGYLNNPGLTAQKFVKIRNSSFPGLGNEGEDSVIYCTGDVGRWWPDGTIDFLGRKDYQVKIRGFRIELGEIEHKMMTHPQVKEAVVIDREDHKGSKYLCAYVTLKAQVEISQLREFLGTALPEYMIPAYFIFLEKIPLTANGKVDRRALPLPGNLLLNKDETSYEAPASRLEKKLAHLWQMVLNQERQPGLTENFFETGGHSLAAVSLQAKILYNLHLDIPLIEIFKNPTIRGMALYLDKLDEVIYTPIPAVEERVVYPLSSTQKRLFLLHDIDDQGIGYNVPVILELKGDIDKSQFFKKLESGFKSLIAHHESLRTGFYFNYEPGQSQDGAGHLVQRIFPYEDIIKNFSMQYFQCPEMGAAKEEVIRGFFQRFDLGQPPLIRVGVMVIKNDLQLLLVDLHHIITDARSNDILTRDLRALLRGESLDMPVIRYRDYVLWQDGELVKDKIIEQERYWLKVFPGEIPVLDILGDFPRPVTQGFLGARVKAGLDVRHTNLLKGFARDNGVTLYILSLSVFNVLLAKYSGQEDILVGTPVEGRRHPDLTGVVGVFINTLVMRNQPIGPITFGNFLLEVKTHVLEAFENQDFPFERLVEKLDSQRRLNRNPLFDVMFNWMNPGELRHQQMDDQGLTLNIYDFDPGIAKFDLNLTAFEQEETILFDLEYSRQIFTRGWAERTIQCFIRLLNSLILAPDQRLEDVDIISSKEKQWLLEEINQTAADYPRDKTIFSMFSDQVEVLPGHTAIRYSLSFTANKIHPDCSGSSAMAMVFLTYQEFYNQVIELGEFLKTKGCQPGDIVAVILERSIERILSTFAILSIGAVYLPIDPTYPLATQSYMLKDSHAQLAITPDLYKSFAGVQGAVFQKSPLVVGGGTDAAYIIYTSGSTGRPKGVMVDHYPVINRLLWMQKMYTLGPADVILQKTPFTFDVSIWELFWWSFNGAGMALPLEGVEKEPGALVRDVERFGVTTIHFVPSMLRVFLDYLDVTREVKRLQGVSRVFCSGEELKVDDVRRFKQVWGECWPVKLHNLYGPTEATVDVSYYSCRGDEAVTVPIGKPIDNTRLYIVKNNRLLPVGVPGELYISGDGLARGYLNQPQLTHERFVCFPVDKEAPFNQRMYRTGDQACWLPGGDIRFIQRLDSQVKVRGVRIELAEIEFHLQAFAGVKEAVVTVRYDRESNGFLCGYLIIDRLEMPVNEWKQDLRKFLEQRLPLSMIPSYLVPLSRSEIKYTMSGKLDKKALPDPLLLLEKEMGTVEGARPDRIEFESLSGSAGKLVQIWSEVLLLDHIGLNSDFFMLGGDSLKAVGVVARVYKEFNVKIRSRDIFQQRTVQALASLIDKQEAPMVSFHQNRIEPLLVQEYFPVSYAQKRIWIHSRFDERGFLYTIGDAFYIHSHLDPVVMEKAFIRLLQAHEILRSTYEIREGELMQRVHTRFSFVFDHVNLPERAEGRVGRESEEMDYVRGFWQKPYDLVHDLPLRAMLIERPGRGFILAVTIHHIAADAWSMVVVARGVAQNYQAIMAGEEQPSQGAVVPRLQYRDYSVWHHRLIQSEQGMILRQYWLKRLENLPGDLPLPLDRFRPVPSSFNGSVVPLSLHRETLVEWGQVNQRFGLTFFMDMLTCVYILLNYYSGQEDIVIGTDVAGRTHVDTKEMIGCFVNILPLRLRAGRGQSVEMMLGQFRDNVLEALENQDYPFDLLVQNVGIKPVGQGRHPLFDVVVSMQDNVRPRLQLGDVLLEPVEKEIVVTHYDLLFYLEESEGSLAGGIRYNTDLFEAATIQLMKQRWQRLMENLPKQLGLPLEKIDLDTPVCMEEGERLPLDIEIENMDFDF